MKRYDCCRLCGAHRLWFQLRELDWLGTPIPYCKRPFGKFSESCYDYQVDVLAGFVYRRDRMNAKVEEFLAMLETDA